MTKREGFVCHQSGTALSPERDKMGHWARIRGFLGIDTETHFDIEA